MRNHPARFLSTSFPAFAQLLEKFPQLVPVFKNIRPGLAWYKPIVETVHAQVSNYAKVDSLPNSNLFTWFFMVPGILLAALSGSVCYTSI
jgi:hypothetical protein